jgi:glycosyltransferase involved in cell wall biosynthesis
LKIAWFTPFQPQSAIGQIGKFVCEELQKSCAVDIFAPDRDQVLSTTVPVIKFQASTFSVRRLDAYDFVVYNMGNYAGNHRDIWEVMQSYPGVLLQHDQIMQNFFAQLTMFPDFGGNANSGEQEYIRLMRASYGADGEAAGQAMWRAYFGDAKVRLWDSEIALAYPLLEPLLAKATAVFSHAAFFIDKIKDHFYGPTGYAYLPHIHETARPNGSIPAEFADPDRALVVSTGIVHPVKRIERVAEMLLANPDIARRVRYVVIGGYGGPYGDYLTSLAEGPLKGCLYLLGYQPDDVMEAFLHKADFSITIRYPNSEVCSKSLIDQMAFANPVIVLNSGVFAELPDDCLVKIHLGNEAQELADAFRRLLNDQGLRREIGRRAAAFVAKHCTVEVYASRLKDFLASISATAASNKLLNDCIQINRQVLSDLAFTPQSMPWAVDALWRELAAVCGAESPPSAGRKVLGVWLGFPYALGLRREGITKFLLYMLSAMLEDYPIDCELWAYSFNEDEVRASFEAILKEKAFASRVKIITEKNFREVLGVPSWRCPAPLEINETLDNLSAIAREHSQAHCFITAIVYLDNVIGAGKPIFVPVHDLGTHAYYDDFVAKDPLNKARHVDIRSRAENLARAGAFMFSNCEHVRGGQVLKHVSSIDASRTAVVYLPTNIPRNLAAGLLPEQVVRQKFSLKKPYLFYPTQIRPYKNVTLLVEALSRLSDRNRDLQLVLTGRPADVPGVDRAIKQHRLADRVICLADVAEAELYSLYRYAAAAVVPTLFEGGFPWQACEALFMGTPLVLSDIPVVRERIEFCGMSPADCGLELFDPHNPQECANCIERVLQDREGTAAKQQPFRDRFLAYSWKDAAARYHGLFFGAEQPLETL